MATSWNPEVVLDTQVEVDSRVSLGIYLDQVALPVPRNTTMSGRRSAKQSLKIIATLNISKFVFYSCVYPFKILG